MCFRDWADSLKQDKPTIYNEWRNKTMSTKKWKNNELMENLSEKFGFKMNLSALKESVRPITEETEDALADDEGNQDDEENPEDKEKTDWSKQKMSPSEAPKLRGGRGSKSPDQISDEKHLAKKMKYHDEDQKTDPDFHVGKK